MRKISEINPDEIRGITEEELRILNILCEREEEIRRSRGMAV